MTTAARQLAERMAYEQALEKYVDASAALTAHAVRGTTPTEHEYRAERDARAALQLARRAWLDALARCR